MQMVYNDLDRKKDTKNARIQKTYKYTRVVNVGVTPNVDKGLYV